jgi:hypothetical protein
MKVHTAAAQQSRHSRSLQPRAVTTGGGRPSWLPFWRRPTSHGPVRDLTPVTSTSTHTDSGGCVCVACNLARPLPASLADNYAHRHSGTAVVRGRSGRCPSTGRSLGHWHECRLGWRQPRSPCTGIRVLLRKFLNVCWTAVPQARRSLPLRQDCRRTKGFSRQTMTAEQQTSLRYPVAAGLPLASLSLCLPFARVLGATTDIGAEDATLP